MLETLSDVESVVDWVDSFDFVRDSEMVAV